MRKGYILAITTVTILVVMLLQMQNFVTRQNSELGSVSQMLVSEKVAHTWSDIKDDISAITDLFIEKMSNNVTFFDSVPKNYSLADLLHLYGVFIDQYYETPDTIIKFLTPGGIEMDLRDLSSRIMIMPFNIEYGYDDWWKNNVFLMAPHGGEENLTVITMVYLNINFTDAIIYCKPANPSGPVSCDQSSYKKCSGTKQKIYLNLSFSDYQGRYYNFPETCFDETFPNVEHFYYLNASGGQYLDVEFGKLTGDTTHDGLALRNGYPAINVTTKLILNTTDFYISFLSLLKVDAVNYNTTRTEGV